MSISIGRESLKVFSVLGALAYLQVPLLGGSRDEKWRAQWIRKRSVSWNLPKLSQLWRCNGGFGPCTAQNHLRTKQFVSGTWNSSRVAACALRNEEAGRGHQLRLSSVCEKRLSGATLPFWRPCSPQCYSSRSLDWARFSQWLSSSSLAFTVTWPNPLRFFLMGLHQGSRVHASYATWFTTAATKDRGGSRCYRPPNVATRVAGTWLEDWHLPRHQVCTYRAPVS